MPPRKIPPPGATKVTRKLDDIKNPEEEDEFLDFNEVNYAKNMSHLKRMRTYSTVMSGISAGILGIEGLYGILFYFLMFFIVSGCILAKAKFNIPNYFRNSNDVVYGGWTNDLMLYIMLWVISHNLVYVL